MKKSRIFRKRVHLAFWEFSTIPSPTVSKTYKMFGREGERVGDVVVVQHGLDFSGEGAAVVLTAINSKKRHQI